VSVNWWKTVRAALGASRVRIARTLLSESVLLALVGGALGLLLAGTGVGLLRRMAPVRLPRVDELGIDPPVLLFTLSISVLTGLVFGAFAVLKFGKLRVAALREGGRSASDGPARHRTRNALVVGQIALALMLLIISGLMIRTVAALRAVQPGFERPQEVQTFRLDITTGLIPDGDQAARTHHRIAERLAEVPGVASVGLASSITMDGENNGNSIDVEDFPVPQGQLSPLRRFKSVAPGYFETMGNHLVAGRSISWSEIYERRPVILISETLSSSSTRLARRAHRRPSHGRVEHTHLGT
jgi:hypothetical protein